MKPPPPPPHSRAPPSPQEEPARCCKKVQAAGPHARPKMQNTGWRRARDIPHGAMTKPQATSDTVGAG